MREIQVARVSLLVLNWVSVIMNTKSNKILIYYCRLITSINFRVNDSGEGSLLPGGKCLPAVGWPLVTQ